MSKDKPKMTKIDASDYTFAIVASRFNQEYVDALLKDVQKTLKDSGVDLDEVRVVRVPGAGEIPHICNMLADSNYYSAIIALGVVIAGETPHHEIIANSTANALQNIALQSSVPIVNGIVVTNTTQQAIDRTTGKIARGEEFAQCAIEIAQTTESIFLGFMEDEMLFDEELEAFEEELKAEKKAAKKAKKSKN